MSWVNLGTEINTTKEMSENAVQPGTEPSLQITDRMP